LVALLQADLFAGVARGRLLEKLVTRPTPERWRDAVAGALDDQSLRLAYWDPGTAGYRQPDGTTLTAPARETGDRWVEVNQEGRPVAAMVIDSVLAEDP